MAKWTTSTTLARETKTKTKTETKTNFSANVSRVALEA